MILGCDCGAACRCASDNYLFPGLIILGAAVALVCLAVALMAPSKEK